ncbi:39S ribosomal protein L12, mitochondrial [Trachymyrmex zeteki]|uniref:39S ribosomal protein L12, mitochondrial n=1 Tax=Mycetomoellerius zeteki TaxID=64791 RepID=A0A151WWI6_9HYME|nr:PREDICTED: 39S ribosomal protein L12, mitochondrial [Trachymyrmex zeteki]KYQ52176.1 39S ribosomal protein L12, mitochondrial [Trachymyrmex zeteki]
MINTIRLVSRQSLPQFRRFHKCVVRQTESSAAAATEVAAPPPPSPPPPSTSSPPSSPSPPSPSDKNPIHLKIDKIANDIIALNLIEVAKLSELLKKRLNLPDAPVMPVGGFVAAAQASEEEEVEQKQVQTEFTVKLMAFDEKQKVPLIKEVKNLMSDMNLVQAKKFVESAPAIVRADISKEEAEKLRDALTKVGATITIV